MRINNEVYLNIEGWTVIGPVAHKLYFRHTDALHKLCYDTGKNVAFVLEVDGTLVAAQSSVENAKQYLTESRVLVIKEVR